MKKGRRADVNRTGNNRAYRRGLVPFNQSIVTRAARRNLIADDVVLGLQHNTSRYPFCFVLCRSASAERLSLVRYTAARRTSRHLLHHPITSRGPRTLAAGRKVSRYRATLIVRTDFGSVSGNVHTVRYKRRSIITWSAVSKRCPSFVPSVCDAV